MRGAKNHKPKIFKSICNNVARYFTLATLALYRRRSMQYLGERAAHRLGLGPSPLGPLGLVPTRRAEMCQRCAHGDARSHTRPPCLAHLLWGIYTGAVGNHTRPPAHLEHLALSRHRAGETREVGLRPSPRESHASTHEMIHCGVGATARGGGRARQGGHRPGREYEPSASALHAMELFACNQYAIRVSRQHRCRRPGWRS